MVYILSFVSVKTVWVGSWCLMPLSEIQQYFSFIVGGVEHLSGCQVPIKSYNFL
jgi:hypothetical protein